MNGGERVHLGPIRPEHTRDGWRLEGDDRGRWRLVKHMGEAMVTIWPTTPWTCAWTVSVDGRTVREASERRVETVQANAEAWVRENR